MIDAFGAFIRDLKIHHIYSYAAHTHLVYQDSNYLLAELMVACVGTMLVGPKH